MHVKLHTFEPVNAFDTPEMYYTEIHVISSTCFVCYTKYTYGVQIEPVNAPVNCFCILLVIYIL